MTDNLKLLPINEKDYEFLYELLSERKQITFISHKKMPTYEELNIFEEIDIIEPTDESPIRKYVPKKIQTIKLDDVDTKFKPGFFQQMTEFSEMIAKNSPPKFGSTLSDAQKTLEIYEELIGVLK